ncbi:MAG TPA: asparagine synthase (glutamine-hydrolyzing) [Alphaproteobacteria bacterium]|jgi:asparagine synthase (glutamine-hydrolysing)|nr:asparagine synthase (glutamine-hydrolyzing) [Alphaproteobacteria bacterium]MDP7164461.1 asparagine synthase (glutamine-hydrolyzing) [Alphaproteobacteria bacterium]MDP7429813.1 asparagine synthase (glutamine-hydrolyzing) [Alphaproteobacteria bacterium]HJM49596.1 asparagine synthase (glutamine-hydrolyzing) [Alphaproteobacteria bacterium]
MCGLAGLMTHDGAPPEAGLLAALSAALAHRGPDGEGSHVAGAVGLVHRRLAIIDLETGAQPLGLPGGPVLVANAEIYNYLELRRELGEENFATRSDCEPALHLYAREGLDFCRRLRGMYALAIHDPVAGRLVLARDPFGIKPLYYAETARGFAFASEPRALLAAGLVTPAVDEVTRGELLELQFTTGRQTIFQGIMRVLPGETIVVEAGRIKERRSLEALPPGGPEPCDESAALARLDEILEESVSLHQRSDVPYAMFLSGGIDSAALLALMARLDDRPVRVFTAGFPGSAVPDERAQADMLARRLGAESVPVAVAAGDFWDLLPGIAAALDDPVADYAVVPTYKLGQVAAADFKVVLTGEGGDELFAGYGRYRSQRRPRWLGGRRPRRRGSFDDLDVLRHDTSGWRGGIVEAERLAAGGGRSKLQAAQAVDCADWLAHDLLLKLDRCLMAHGLEGRVPLLDRAVAEFAFALPDRLKLRRRLGKYLLRRWLSDHLPEALPFSRKRGFTVPVGEWIAARGADVGPLVAAQPGIAEIARPDRVAALFMSRDRRQGFAAWTLLFYALWHQIHILGCDPAGDVAAVLSERR